MRTTACIALGGLMLLAQSSAAQSLNVDLGTRATGAPGFGPPNDAFGGAANQPGRWNNYTGENTEPLQLVDLAGMATSVLLTRTLGAGGNSFFDSPNTTGDHQLLIDDYHNIGGIGSNVGYFFQNLAAGLYEVYTYAIDPSNAANRTDVTIAGNTQTVGGLMPVNAFSQGVTHALHTINHAGGNLTILISTSALPPGNLGSVNGFQLVLVPEAGSMALLALAAMVSGRPLTRRRRLA